MYVTVCIRMHAVAWNVFTHEVIVNLVSKNGPCEKFTNKWTDKPYLVVKQNYLY